MAFVRLVLGDQSSAEMDQLRRTTNALLFIMENVAGFAFTTFTDQNETWVNILSTGIDSDFTTGTSADSYVGTGLELVGLRPMNRHPRRPGSVAGTQMVAMVATDGAA